MDINNLELEQPCTCKNPIMPANCVNNSCDICHGKGVVLTEFGAKVLALMEKYSPWSADLEALQDDISNNYATIDGLNAMVDDLKDETKDCVTRDDLEYELKDYVEKCELEDVSITMSF